MKRLRMMVCVGVVLAVGLAGSVASAQDWGRGHQGAAQWQGAPQRQGNGYSQGYGYAAPAYQPQMTWGRPACPPPPVFRHPTVAWCRPAPCPPPVAHCPPPPCYRPAPTHYWGGPQWSSSYGHATWGSNRASFRHGFHASYPHQRGGCR